jgi:hypothetical protein
MTHRLLAAIGAVCAAGLLAGCTTVVSGTATTAAPVGRPASTGPAASGAPAAAPASGAADLLTGAYGLRALEPKRSGSRIAVRSREDCTQALDLLAAGQWRLTRIGKPTEALPLYIAVLEYADQLAVAFLQESGKQCSGSITVETTQQLTVSGPVTANGEARALAFYCQVGPDLNSNSDKDIVVAEFGLYRTAGRTFLVIVSGPATKGTHKLQPGGDDDLPIAVVPLDPKLSSTSAIAALLSQFGGSGDGTDMERYLLASYRGAGTLVVSSSDPFVATLDAPALAGEKGGAKLAVKVGLRCDT